MLKNSLRLLQSTRSTVSINNVLFHKSAILREKWDLLTAVLIERKPVITPELNDLEKSFKDYLSAVEFERSLKSETEINFEKEKQMLIQKQELDEIDKKTKQSTQDFIDACKEEFAKFKPAERITEADKSNDEKSLKRKLDKSLILVMKQKIGEENFFILPQGQRQEGETLRQCADRVLREKCGSDIKVQVFGNAPCGFYKFKYPKGIRDEKSSTGAKVFIYFGRYSSGQIGEKQDFKWLDKSELEHILPLPYQKSVLPVLFD